MALQKQNVPISFEGGLDTKTDPKQAIPGSFSALENAVRVKGKAFAKRYGYDQLAAPAGSSSGRAVRTFKDQLLKFEDHKVYNYISKTNSWAERGDAVPCHVETRQIIRNSYAQSKPDSVTNQNITVFAYVENSEVKATVFDEVSKALVVHGEMLGSGNDNPKVLAFGDKVYVFVTNGANISRYDLDVTVPDTFTAATFSITDLDVIPNYDVDTDGTICALIYNSSATSTTTKVQTFDDVTDSIDTATISDNSNAGNGVVIDSAGRIWAFYTNSTSGLYCHIYDSELTTVTSGFAVDATLNRAAVKVVGVETVGGAGIKVFYSWFSEGPAGDVYSAELDTSGVTEAGAIYLYNSGIAARPFSNTVDGSSYYYLPIYNISSLQPTYFVTRSDKVVVAKFQVGVATDEQPFYAQRISSLGNGRFSFCYLNQGRVVSGDNSLFTIDGLGRAILDFEPDYTFSSIQVGDSLIVAGGVVSMYDGASYVEKGFHLYPELSNVVSDNLVDGELTPEATYQYRALYEWTDNEGKIHRSAPSPAKSVTIGASDNLALFDVPYIQLTTKENVLVAIYRTEGNGSVFYRLTSVDPEEADFPAVINDKDTEEFEYIDKMSDADLISREILYTTGGIIENIAPPAANHVSEYKNRAILTDVEGSDVAWYSKAASPTAPAEFTDLFTIDVIAEGGKLRASGTIDDKLILFKNDRPFYFYGEGPNPAGVGAFTEPEAINIDVGVSEPASVVSLPAGLAFKSNKGIYLLGRDLSSQYIGAPVEEWNAEVITGAELHSDVNQIRFTTAAGPCLVFDYYFGQWSTFTNHTAQGCTVWQNRFVRIAADGSVLKENYAVFKDDGTSYNLRAVLGWLSFAGIQGFQRIYRAAFLGELKSAHELEINVGYDFKDAYPSTIAFDSADLEAGETYQIKSHLRQQKCQAIRFEITETTGVATLGTQEALTMSAITLEVGLKRGINKLRSGLTVKAT